MTGGIKEIIKEVIIKVINEKKVVSSNDLMKEIENYLKKGGEISKRTIRNYIKELINERIIVSIGKYRGKKYYVPYTYYLVYGRDIHKKIEEIKSNKYKTFIKEKVKSIILYYYKNRNITKEQVKSDIMKYLRDLRTLKEVIEIETKITEELREILEKDNYFRKRFIEIMEEVEREFYFRRIVRGSPAIEEEYLMFSATAGRF